MAATNTFENTDLVLAEAIDSLDNVLTLANKVDRSLDTEFSSKVGNTIEIRRPMYFAVSDGAVVQTADINDLTEGTVSIAIDTRKKVVIEVDSSDLALEITDSRIQEYIRGAAHQLAQSMETSIATEMGTKVFNYVDSTTGVTLDAIADADALLTQTGVNTMDERYGGVTPKARRNMAKEIGQDFQRPSEARVTDAMDRAIVGRYSNVEIMENQSIYRHTWGTYTASGVINGADQDVAYSAVKNTFVQNLITDGWTSGGTDLKEGDIITIADVYQINRATKQSTGDLQQFVIQADISDTTGDLTMSISPPIIESGQFQTVSAKPLDGAQITVLEASASTSNQNLVFLRDCCELAMVTLPAAKGGATSSSVSDPDTGLAMRAVWDFDFDNDLHKLRLDIEYGVSVKNAFYGVRVGGI
jgi:hypothetical protein